MEDLKEYIKDGQAVHVNYGLLITELGTNFTLRLQMFLINTILLLVPLNPDSIK